MAKSIEDIEGIGPAFGEKLRAARVTTPDALLEKGATKRGREELSQNTEIPESLILRWVNMADLFRVKGVAGQYAELLEAAGVDTVKELRNRNAENLAAKLAEVNASRKLCRQAPSGQAVSDWVEQAKNLPPMVEY
jgi:predicted flap endonuclease-1-like 5' DNA nuclease